MPPTICLLPSTTLDYPEGGGHLWVYLNWALGLRAAGCRVIWLEVVADGGNPYLRANLESLRRQLGEFGLAEDLAVTTESGGALPEDLPARTLEEAAEADLLVNLRFGTSAALLRRFRRSALIDTDPGLLQVWQANGEISLAPHDIHFSIGETVGQANARFPSGGLSWNYTPPPVFLPEWPVTPPDPEATYTTVAHWWYGDMTLEGETFSNDKRTSFLGYLDLPARTDARLELALCLGDDQEDDRLLWKNHGWTVREAWEVTSSAADYRRYLQRSRGEFSCAKPSCMRLQNAWISDRTLCYLASGKPAIVQHTGPSRFLPEGEGLFRFKTIDEAAAALARVESDYDRQCRSARALAEQYFDATKVATAVLEKALP